MEKWNTEKQPMDGFTPFSANVVTYQARALLPSGTYTVAQNVRDFRPGLKKRPGLASIAPYNYLGQTVDIRPLYTAGSGDGGPEIYRSIISGYSDIYSNPDDCRNQVSDNTTRHSEHTTTLMGPGLVQNAGGDENQIGRIGCTFNLRQYFYATTLTSASLFVLVKGYAGPLAAVNANIRVIAVQTNTELGPDDGLSPPTGLLTDVNSSGISDPVTFDHTAFLGSEYVLEIPLNQDGLDAIETALSGNGYISIVLMEYDHDYELDPNTGYNGSHYLNTRLDNYWPFLRMTFSDDVPHLVSLYQYQQIRSETSETIACFSNGDIISSNVTPPITRGDVRTDAVYGDNSGYYPYSDGLPTAGGPGNLAAMTPSYDSKWGFFAYRPTGINEYTLDWDHSYQSWVNTYTTKYSFGVLDDILILANGVGLAKFYGGSGGQPAKASLFIETPADGDTGVFRDDWDTTGITVSHWGDQTSEIYIFTPILCGEFEVTVVTPQSAAATLLAYYWDGSGWQLSDSDYLLDETESSGKSMAVSGTIKSNEILSNNQPQRFYGLSGYWVKFKWSANPSSFSAKFKAKYSFQTLTNVWDGTLQDVIETKFFDASAGASGVYYTYASTAIDVSLMTSSDYVYFATYDIPVQVFIDIGSTPNTGDPVGTLSFQYWDGDQWLTWTVISDGTSGLIQSGFVKLDTSSVTSTLLGSQKRSFQGSSLNLHWFRMAISQTCGDDLRISMSYEPYLTLDSFGDNVNCCCVFKERAVYSFDKFSSWLYITRNGTVNVLNGSDYAVLQAGDGRRNKIVAMRKFQNELMVWQEEKGTDGGCLTLFEGYSPTSFGKLLLSSKYGTLNADTVVVIDGAYEASRTDYRTATVAYFLSNYGVFMTDGQTVTMISQAINNYFDPTHADCIRNGYQQKCWLSHDPTHHVLRMGIVSGSSATEPNIFPVYDLMTKRWSFDAFAAHTITAMCEVSGDTSNSAVQVAMIAGTQESDIFNASSSNLSDESTTAIDMQVRIEFNASGHLMDLREIAIRMKKQSAGNATFKVYENGVLNTDHNKTIDMTQGDAGEENVVERLILGAYQEDMISVFLQNNTLDQDMYLYDYWIDMDKLINR